MPTDITAATKLGDEELEEELRESFRILNTAFTQLGARMQAARDRGVPIARLHLLHAAQAAAMRVSADFATRHIQQAPTVWVQRFYRAAKAMLEADRPADFPR